MFCRCEFRKEHTGNIRWQYRLAAGPKRKRPKANEYERYPFCPDSSSLIPVDFRQKRGHNGKERKYDNARYDKNDCFVVKRGKKKAKGDYCSKIIDKAGA